MTRTVKFLNSADREQAAEEMLTEQLVFSPRRPSPNKDYAIIWRLTAINQALIT